jgi:gag-polypeptide of LTR copia-type
MPTSSSTMEQLPTYIPRLDPTSANWAIFRLHFRQAMIACCRWQYLDGMKACPVPKDEEKPTDTEAADLETWDHNDFMARFLLSQRTPDTSSLALSHCSTAKEAWTKLTTEYQAKSSYAQNDLEQTFLDMRCAKGEDVRTFLRGVQYKHDELSVVGVTISDHDYRRTVLRGIPGRLAEFASWILTSCGSSNPTDTDTLIGDICEEADRTKNRCGRDQQGKGEAKQQDQPDEALAITDSNTSGSNE